MLETRLTKTPKPLQSIPKLTAVPCSSTSKFKGITLFSYQVTGVNWMAANFHSNRSVILADEMGLGKTAQVIIFLEYLRKTVGLGFPFLVIAPMSTMGHWRREVQRFTGIIKVLHVHLIKICILLFIMEVQKINKLYVIASLMFTIRYVV